MTSTPYFDAYERMRTRRANTRAINFFERNPNSTRVNLRPPATLFVDEARITGALYDSGNRAGSPGQVLQTTGTGITWNDVTNCISIEEPQIPEYRLRKTYTFIGEVRVLADCILESRNSIEDEWTEVPETFNNYVYN